MAEYCEVQCKYDVAQTSIGEKTEQRAEGKTKMWEISFLTFNGYLKIESTIWLIFIFVHSSSPSNLLCKLLVMDKLVTERKR